MKELYRERDYSIVGYHQSILEAEGIPTIVRNRDLVGMTTEVPIPDMFPALCVVDDADYERALEILKEAAPPEGGRQEYPMKPMFLVGVILIFGSIAVSVGALFVMNLEYLSGPDPPAVSLVTQALVILGAFWVIAVNIRRFRAGRGWSGDAG